MTLVNFSHPLTPVQLAEIERQAKAPVERVIDVKTQFDNAQPFAEQARATVDSIGLTPSEWQSLPLLVNLPSFNAIAALVMAELHGRMGCFPSVVRLRPIVGSAPAQFEVAEILNLQSVRDRARVSKA
jgi:hypothetical protein